MTDISLEKSVLINAPAEKVWDALTNPSMIKKYLFGTEAVSEWRAGSSIYFKGTWEGNKYLDKGVILQSDPGKILQYTYLSSFSNLEDKEENYAIVTFRLNPEKNITKLTLTQENIQSEESRDHSAGNWEMVLNTIKNMLERAEPGRINSG